MTCRNMNAGKSPLVLTIACDESACASAGPIGALSMSDLRSSALQASTRQPVLLEGAAPGSAQSSEVGQPSPRRSILPPLPVSEKPSAAVPRLQLWRRTSWSDARSSVPSLRDTTWPLSAQRGTPRQRDRSPDTRVSMEHRRGQLTYPGTVTPRTARRTARMAVVTSHEVQQWRDSGLAWAFQAAHCKVNGLPEPAVPPHLLVAPPPLVTSRPHTHNLPAVPAAGIFSGLGTVISAGELHEDRRER
jgi:hypothetical protein